MLNLELETNAARLSTEETKSAKSNHSVEKVLTVLEMLVQQPEPIRLNECARLVGLNKSTTLRLLTTLQRHGYVAQDIQDGRYCITLKLCALASQVQLNNQLRDICLPFLRNLSQVFQESINLSIESEMNVLYIDVVNNNQQTLTTMQRVGNTAPMHCTGSGKLMLTNFNELELARFLAERGLPKITPHTIDAPERLREELALVRSRGYSYDNEECALGMRCVAVPIRDYTGKVTAGISISGPASRMTDAFVDPRFPVLQAAAQAISFRMGYEEK